jgi:ankyrin repeat protein
LQAASGNGHEEIVKLLLNAGAKVNAKGGEYGSALVAAAENNNEKVVQLLLQAGGSISWGSGNVPWGIPFWQ